MILKGRVLNADVMWDGPWIPTQHALIAEGPLLRRGSLRVERQSWLQPFPVYPRPRLWAYERCTRVSHPAVGPNFRLLSGIGFGSSTSGFETYPSRFPTPASPSHSKRDGSGYGGLLRALGMTRLGCRFRLTLKPDAAEGGARTIPTVNCAVGSRGNPMSLPEELATGLDGD